MPAPLPRALLIDLDGTLIEAGQRLDVLQEVATDFAEDLGGVSPEVVADALNSALRSYWADPESNAVGRMDIHAARRNVLVSALVELGQGRWDNRICDRFARRFADQRDASLQVAPGVVQTLAELRSRGVRMALVTNGPASPQREKLARFKLEPFFHHVQIEGERGFGKPDPRAYQEPLCALDAQASDAWMIGDDLYRDVAAPQSLGLQGVWRDRWGAGPPPSSKVKPDRTIRNLADLVR
jgi:putative hydrolase of the HAD superfamily